MRLLRRLLPVALAANLLFVGFVASMHVHVHHGDCDHGETASEPAAHGHCCGHHHGHSHASGEDESEAPVPTPHDHDDCSVCQLIATSWLSPTIVEPPAFSSPVRLLPLESVTDPAIAPLSLPCPRGPPSLV